MGPGAFTGCTECNRLEFQFGYNPAGLVCESVPRLSYITKSHCDGFTFHGRNLECAVIGKGSGKSETVPVNDMLFKYITPAKIYFKPKECKSDKMIYKSFIPDDVSNTLTDLPSKLPYILLQTSEAISPKDSSSYFKLVIFSCENDMNDFIYENRIGLQTLPYSVKRVGQNIQNFNGSTLSTFS